MSTTTTMINDVMPAKKEAENEAREFSFKIIE
jgi:hypothetical protein